MAEESKNSKKSALDYVKNFWNFIWNDDSLLSWVAFMIIAFVLIKFIFFPGLSFITGTSLPIVIVESCSMHHGINFETWWDKNSEWYNGKDIQKEDFESFKFKNGFTKGDIFFVFGTKKEDIKVGDIIIFQGGTSKRPIIHRVVGINPLETKGDNNYEQFSSSMSQFVNPEKIDEQNISESQLIGKVVGFKIPYLGWIKLALFEPFRPAYERGFCNNKENI